VEDLAAGRGRRPDPGGVEQPAPGGLAAESGAAEDEELSARAGDRPSAYVGALRFESLDLDPPVTGCRPWRGLADDVEARSLTPAASRGRHAFVNDERVLAAVEAKRADALAAHRFVHEHPELAHEEQECARYLSGVLEEAGLEVERGVAGMSTAFRATLRGAAPGRSVGLVALYDAVPVFRPNGEIESVHSCGHDAISGGVVATALALADLRDELTGSLVVFGCPADEIPAPLTVEHGGGKAVSAAVGLWDDIDAALYAHPEFEDTVFQRSRWMRRDRAMVTGTRSLTGEREGPVDAVLAAIAAVRTLPAADAIVEHLALDGDVEEGGGLVLRAHFLLRADEESELDELAKALREGLPDAVWESDPVVCGLKPNEQVTSAVKDAVLAVGGEFVDDPGQLPFGTDFGNVSQRVPSALIGIGRPGGWAFHTDEGARQFLQDGEECALSIARVLALASARLLAPS
jgi:metal-dependent amidase/aminoacylase/carboxypeptidase family protein